MHAQLNCAARNRGQVDAAARAAIELRAARALTDGEWAAAPARFLEFAGILRGWDGKTTPSGQVSARLQCAGSTVRKLIVDGELRASRISSRTIRISGADLQTYLDGRANVSAPNTASARINEAAQ